MRTPQWGGQDSKGVSRAVGCAHRVDKGEFRLDLSSRIFMSICVRIRLPRVGVQASYADVAIMGVPKVVIALSQSDFLAELRLAYRKRRSEF